MSVAVVMDAEDLCGPEQNQDALSDAWKETEPITPLPARLNIYVFYFCSHLGENRK